MDNRRIVKKYMQNPSKSLDVLKYAWNNQQKLNKISFSGVIVLS